MKKLLYIFVVAVYTSLLAIASSNTYSAMKFSRKVFVVSKIPLCFTLLSIMMFVPQMTFASSLSLLPDYSFGAGNGENTIYFDTISTNNVQLNYVNPSHSSQLSIDGISQNYNDGDLIGKLTVQKLGRVINIYEGESLASMDKGGGRFSFTGMNSGNTSVIGHNRGRTNGYFIFVKDLREGDILTLEMAGVTKNYAVTHMYTVSDTDFSPLMQFNDSRLTLVTCLENHQNIRRIVVAMEI